MQKTVEETDALYSRDALRCLSLCLQKEECEEEEKEDEEERDDDLEYTWLCYDDDCRVQLEDSVAKNLQRRQLILNALKKEKRYNCCRQVVGVMYILSMPTVCISQSVISVLFTAVSDLR